LAVAGSALIAVAGLAIAAPRVLIGHVTNLLPILSFISFSLLVTALPATLVLCNMAAYGRGGRRALRCFGITATIIGGLVLVSLFAGGDAAPGRPEFNSDGSVILSFTNVRVRGLLAWAVSLGIPALAAWILLRPVRSVASATDALPAQLTI
jgi:hypothetical protein